MAQTNGSDRIIDSVIKYRKLSQNPDLETNKKIDYAKKAIIFSESIANDSTILKSKKNLSFLYLVNGELDLTKKINLENLKLANKIKDSSAIANAYYILGYVYDEEVKTDSAYYYYSKAAKVYHQIKDFNDEADVLFNMSNIQEYENDYIGAEINAIKAKQVLEKLPRTQANIGSLRAICNLLGVISSSLKEYDNALDYYEEALFYSGKLEDNRYDLYSKTNIVSIYRKKKEYQKAIEGYSKILEDKSLKLNDSLTYSNIISNLAYSKFLNKDKDNIEIKKLFNNAINISDDLEDEVGLTASSSYFSEFLIHDKQFDSALYYANLSNKMAEKSNLTDFYLKSLIIKSKLVKDSSSFLLNQHIKLTDSLLLNERKIRNKFIRIEYETDEIIQENQLISRQRLWLIITSIGLLVTLFFLYIIKSQREKNKELQLERQQQEANEEIYNLMLSQQDKIDEARSLEKNRISKDIHDGILGKLFGVRLSLDGLNLSTTPEATKKRSNYIGELKNIEEEIRKVSHELNSDFIQQSGYLDIIKTLVDAQMTAYNIKYTLTADEDINWDALNNKIKIHVYRILQETMQNAYKHANATMVDISFKLDKNILTLAISDNGEGFDLQKAKKGIGLKNIDSRIKEINGKLEIKTQKKQGTKIIINVPALNN
ncbi:MAG: ATP-binding protein [Olleya sp.]